MPAPALQGHERPQAAIFNDIYDAQPVIDDVDSVPCVLGGAPRARLSRELSPHESTRAAAFLV